MATFWNGADFWLDKITLGGSWFIFYSRWQMAKHKHKKAGSVIRQFECLPHSQSKMSLILQKDVINWSQAFFKINLYFWVHFLLIVCFAAVSVVETIVKNDKHDSSNYMKWSAWRDSFWTAVKEYKQPVTTTVSVFLRVVGWWRAPVWTWDLMWGKETWVAVSSPRRWADAFPSTGVAFGSEHTGGMGAPCDGTCFSSNYPQTLEAMEDLLGPCWHSLYVDTDVFCHSWHES